MKKISLFGMAVMLSAASLTPVAIAQAVADSTSPAAEQEQASAQTIRFIKQATIGGNYEVQASQIALKKSQNGDVKEFAQVMVNDHTKAADQLRSTLTSNRLDTVASSGLIDGKHQKLLNTLSSLTGADFDKAYITQQTGAHKETVSLFQNYAKNGDNAALKDFATQTLPTLQSHLKHVEQLAASDR